MATTGGADVDLLRRRVLNVVGHELRTPVSTVRGLADELAARYGDDDLVEALARNARRLDRLVDDLLLAAAVAAWERRAGGIPLAVAGEAVARARLPVVVKVLDMVVDNAIVHGEPPYTLTGSTHGDCVVIELANGGAPISDADLELAIEAFYRSERGVTNAPGLGLGLAIANTLVTADGGTLSLRPGDSSGVVARVELPAG